MQMGHAKLYSRGWAERSVLGQTIVYLRSGDVAITFRGVFCFVALMDKKGTLAELMKLNNFTLRISLEVLSKLPSSAAVYRSSSFR